MTRPTLSGGVALDTSAAPHGVVLSRPANGASRSSSTLGSLDTPWTATITVLGGESVRYVVDCSTQTGADGGVVTALARNGTIIDRTGSRGPGLDNEYRVKLSGVDAPGAGTHTYEVYIAQTSASAVFLASSPSTSTASTANLDGMSAMQLQRVITGTAAGGGVIGLVEQSYSYPTTVVTDTDLCHDTSAWTDVGANAWTSFTSDGANISAYVTGGSKTSRSRYVLTNTKAAAFDVRLGILPHFHYWSASDDTSLTIYLKTAADAQIAGLTIIGNGGIDAGLRTFRTAGSSSFTTENNNVFPQGLPITLRIARDGSNVVKFQYGYGSMPFALVDIVQTADNAPSSYTSSGTLARVEIESVTAASNGSTARVGFKLDYLQSV